MYSPESSAHLYVVQARFGNNYREHVGSCQSHDFYDAKDLAFRLDRWLKRGWAHDLPDEALDLRGELLDQGIPPESCVVEVVKLDAVAPGRFDTAGQVWCVVCDCTEDEEGVLEDTVIVVGGEREFVSVVAEVR